YNADFLLHALAHLFDFALGVHFKPGNQFHDSVSAGHAPVLLQKTEVGPAVHISEKGNFSGNIAQIFLNPGGIFPAVHTIYGTAAAPGPEKSHQVTNGGGFPGAVWPQKAENLSGSNGKAQVKDTSPLTVIPGQV